MCARGTSKRFQAVGIGPGRVGTFARFTRAGFRTCLANFATCFLWYRYFRNVRKCSGFCWAELLRNLRCFGEICQVRRIRQLCQISKSCCFFITAGPATAGRACYDESTRLVKIRRQPTRFTRIPRHWARQALTFSQRFGRDSGIGMWRGLAANV